MKRLINRIHKIDRIQLTVNMVILAVFAPLIWGSAKLTGLLIDGGKQDSISGAASSGYVLGYLMSIAFGDLIRRTGNALIARLSRRAQAKKTVTE